jgi:hypothetical protein
MTTSAFTGPLSTFTQKLSGLAGSYTDQGFCQMAQTATITQNGTNAVTVAIYLPQGSQIISITPDVTVAFDSVTSATLTAGTAAAGTQYVSGVNAKTTGRAAPTYTAAQLTAMANIGATNVGIFITVTPVGATTVGTVIVTVQYIQQPQAGDQP